MAIDSERKRKSVLTIGFYAVGPVIVADGSFDQGDRQAIGYGYYGILAGPAIDTRAGYLCFSSAYVSVPKATATIAKAYATGSISC